MIIETSEGPTSAVKSAEMRNNSIEKFNSPERRDSFDILYFTEEQCPDLALEALRIHAESFVLAKFVKPSALVEVQTGEGQTVAILPDDLDKSRGPEIQYTLAVSKKELRDPMTDEVIPNAATWRMVDVPEGGTREDLPSYQVSKDFLYDWGAEYLRDIDEDPNSELREIAALGRAKASNPEAVFEMIRDGIHLALNNPKHEYWFFTIVDKTYSALKREFGEMAVMQIGDPIVIDDPRVNPDVRLVPVATDTRLFIEQIYASSTSHDAFDDLRRRQSKRFHFFTQGLHDEQLGGLADIRRVLDWSN